MTDYAKKHYKEERTHPFILFLILVLWAAAILSPLLCGP